jgi:hypothetical protein
MQSLPIRALFVEAQASTTMTLLLHVIPFDPASSTELDWLHSRQTMSLQPNTHRRQRISIPETMAQQEVQLTDLNPSQLQEVKRQLDEVRLTKAPKSKELNAQNLTPSRAHIVTVQTGDRAPNDVLHLVEASSVQVSRMSERY